MPGFLRALTGRSKTTSEDLDQKQKKARKTDRRREKTEDGQSQKSPTPHTVKRFENQVTPHSTAAGVSRPYPANNEKVSYWDRAAEKLKRDAPKTYEGLQELTVNGPCYTEALPTELFDIIQKKKKILEERQWSLPFKVRGRDLKIRDQLDTVLKVLYMFKDFGSVLTSVDPVHAGIPW